MTTTTWLIVRQRTEHDSCNRFRFYRCLILGCLPVLVLGGCGTQRARIGPAPVRWEVTCRDGLKSTHSVIADAIMGELTRAKVISEEPADTSRSQEPTNRTSPSLPEHDRPTLMVDISGDVASYVQLATLRAHVIFSCDGNPSISSLNVSESRTYDSLDKCPKAIRKLFRTLAKKTANKFISNEDEILGEVFLAASSREAKNGNYDKVSLYLGIAKQYGCSVSRSQDTMQRDNERMKSLHADLGNQIAENRWDEAVATAAELTRWARYSSEEAKTRLGASRYYGGRATSQLAEGRYAEAIKTASKAENVAPAGKEGRKLSQAAKLTSEAATYALESKVAFKRKDYSAALSSIRSARIIEPHLQCLNDIEADTRKVWSEALLRQAQALQQETRYFDALDVCKKGLEVSDSNTALDRLYPELIKRMQSTVQQQAEGYVKDRRAKEAVEILHRAETYEGSDALESLLRKARQIWSSQLFDQAKNRLKDSRYGQAILHAFLSKSVSNESPGDNTDVINACLKGLRERVTYRVLVHDFENNSGSPELAGRLRSSLLRHLQSHSLPTLQIVDRRIDVLRRVEAKRLGIELESQNPFSVMIVGTAYQLKKEDLVKVTQNEVRAKVGTRRVPNPEKQALATLIHGTQFHVDSTQVGKDRATGHLKQSGLDTLLWAKELHEAPVITDAMREVTMFGLLGLLDSAMQYQERSQRLQKARAQMEQLRLRYENAPAYIEESVFANVEANSEVHVRIGLGRCDIVIVNFADGRPIWERSYSAAETSTDLFRKGSSATGTTPDPLELRSKTDIEELVIAQLEEKLKTGVFDVLRSYGLGFAALAESAHRHNNHLLAVENGASFLASHTALSEKKAVSDVIGILSQHADAIAPPKLRLRPLLDWRTQFGL